MAMAMPVMAAAPMKMGMDKVNYPGCGVEIGAPCIIGYFLPCLAAKMSWDKLDRIRPPEEQQPKEEKQGTTMCLIVFASVAIGALFASSCHCFGIWYQRSELANKMDYTPPDAVMDIICSWCCCCCTFMQDDKAINQFEPVYQKKKMGGMMVVAAPMQAMAAPMMAAPMMAPQQPMQAQPQQPMMAQPAMEQPKPQ